MASTPLRVFICARVSRRPWGAAAASSLGASERRRVGQESEGRGEGSSAGSYMAEMVWAVLGFVKREGSKNYQFLFFFNI